MYSHPSHPRREKEVQFEFGSESKAEFKSDPASESEFESSTADD
jgi:hypothetical protein